MHVIALMGDAWCRKKTGYRRNFMHTFCRLTLILGVMAVNVLCAGITFEVSDAGLTQSGDSVYRYTYTLSGFTFQENMELDIRFDPALFSSLSNPVAPVDFDTLILQPNNPPGAFGDYKPLALIDNPSLSGLFSVDFTLIGP